MPLPTAPTKPAAILALTQAVLAKRANVAPRSAKPEPIEADGAPAPTLRALPRPESRSGAGPRPPGAEAALASGPEPVPIEARRQPQVTPGPPATARATEAHTFQVPDSARLSKATTTRPSRRGAQALRRRQQDGASKRLFVLDTNVLMHDPSCLFRFAEHDVYLPIVTLEELDNHKRGASEVSRNVRQVSRSLDGLLAAHTDGIDTGISLADEHDTGPRGRLFFQSQTIEAGLPASLAPGKADNSILAVVAGLKQQHPDRDVVLVSKDINMRIKAAMLGLAAEDYFSDQVTEDTDLLHTGIVALPADFWDTHAKGMESWQERGHTFYRLSGPMVRSLGLNQFVWLDGEPALSAQVVERSDRHVALRTVRDFSHLKNAVWGITARNREQNYALSLLMDPDIDFVTLLGQAGTGKTLLALAAGLAQVLESKRFTEIIMTRATVPVGDDIGYLPGTEEEKMQPWMGALEDNLEVLNKGDPAAGEWGRSATQDLIAARIRVKALSFMRGRTFINKFLIIDEAQNLTPKQIKTLVTRAGPGTKVVCLGNVAQIDTPYLTEASSGLSFVVERMKGWAHAGHVTLQRGERSRLADYAADAL